MSEKRKIHNIAGLPGEGVAIWTLALLTTLIFLGNGFLWIEWSAPAFVISWALLIYRYHSHEGFAGLLFIVAIFMAQFFHYSFASLKESAINDAIAAHRAMIGCRDADIYLAFGGAPQPLEGRAIPTDATLVRCSDEEDGDNVRQFLFIIEKERLFGKSF